MATASSVRIYAPGLARRRSNTRHAPPPSTSTRLGWSLTVMDAPATTRTSNDQTPSPLPSAPTVDLHTNQPTRKENP
jgi:hypothetical protein